MLKISPPWINTNPSWLPECQPHDFFSSAFNFLEFNTALSSTKDKSACGMDGIDYQIIKKLPIKYRLLLLDIYNALYKSGDYPDNWKKSFVHFIPKSAIKVVRPIALTSCMCKLFESLIKNRLQWWCESKNIFPLNQSGFRKGRSCADNLLNLTLCADQALTNHKDLLAAFLDVCGAFDNVVCDILLQKLASIGCTKNVLSFVKFFIYQREIYSDHLNNKYRTTGKGVPLGGVLDSLSALQNLSSTKITVLTNSYILDIKKCIFQYLNKDQKKQLDSCGFQLILDLLATRLLITWPRLQLKNQSPKQ